METLPADDYESIADGAWRNKNTAPTTSGSSPLDSWNNSSSPPPWNNDERDNNPTEYEPPLSDSPLEIDGWNAPRWNNENDKPTQTYEPPTYDWNDTPPRNNKRSDSATSNEPVWLDGPNDWNDVPPLNSENNAPATMYEPPSLDRPVPDPGEAPIEEYYRVESHWRQESTGDEPSGMFPLDLPADGAAPELEYGETFTGDNDDQAECAFLLSSQEHFEQTLESLLAVTDDHEGRLNLAMYALEGLSTVVRHLQEQNLALEKQNRAMFRLLAIHNVVLPGAMPFDADEEGPPPSWPPLE
jgi:hypothetical protein